MADPREPGQGPAALLQVAPSVRTAAGVPLVVAVTVTNTSDHACVVSLAALGVDPTWTGQPVRTPLLEPGGTLVAEVTIAPPTGTLPARYPLVVTGQLLDPETGRPVGTSTGLAET